MHRNPVKRGLVASPELWKWSSFRAYSLGEAGSVKVNAWEVLKMKIRPPAAYNWEKAPPPAARQPTSRKAREVGHPRFALVRVERRAAY